MLKATWVVALVEVEDLVEEIFEEVEVLVVDEEGLTQVEDLVVAAVEDLVVEKVRQQLLLMDEDFVWYIYIYCYIAGSTFCFQSSMA